MQTFMAVFTERATENFGSEWTWLVKNSDGALDIVNTADAATPITGDDQPLLACDVWEHAYYIDYRHDRAAYLRALWKLVNWHFGSRNLT